MKCRYLLPLLIAAAPPPEKPVLSKVEGPVLAPSEIVTAASASDWVAIAASDLLVMDLAPDAKGKPRRVVIQLMPPPFSQGWVGNIRKLAAARWWDGTSINRVQDNYVVQWGDASEKKALPSGLATVGQAQYAVDPIQGMAARALTPTATDREKRMWRAYVSLCAFDPKEAPKIPCPVVKGQDVHSGRTYAALEFVYVGWPLASDYSVQWPIHCYGMVGVGRDMPPDTGTGAELYTVIGHAPRHLDRNIALVGRVIEGIEHLSSLPRGTGALGFYEKAEERVPILSVRIGTEVKDLPRFEYLSTESESFARYADARANRRDAFFIQPVGGADICNIPVPVRRAG